MENQPKFDQWADICEDMLYEIAQRIHSSVDYVRFRSTCKNWYINLPKYFKHCPLLLLPSDDNKSESLRQIFHPVENKVIDHLSLPEAKDTVFRGSCFGWLIMIGTNDTIRILNPITKVQFHLPPISTSVGVSGYDPVRYDKEYTIRGSNGVTYTFAKWFMQRVFYYKIVLSCSPDDENQDFMAVAIAQVDSSTSLCYCRRGDEKWTRLTESKGLLLYDVIFHKEKIYAVCALGSIYEYDMKTLRGGLSRSPSFDDNVFFTADVRTYLVQCSGDFILVVKRVPIGFYKNKYEGEFDDEDEDEDEDDEDELQTSRFLVFKLDESQNKWVEVKNLNNNVLVLGYNSSCVLPHAISPNGRGNCIYYSDNWVESQTKYLSGGYDNGIFNLEDGTIYPLFPDRDVIDPGPIWLL